MELGGMAEDNPWRVQAAADIIQALRDVTSTHYRIVEMAMRHPADDISLRRAAARSSLAIQETLIDILDDLVQERAEAGGLLRSAS
jgi:hypothetical protein